MVINLTEAQAWTGYLMVWARFVGMVMLFPLFSWGGIPPQLRVGISLALALLVFLSAGGELYFSSGHTLELLGSLFNEILTGLALGFLTVLFFSLYMYAGQMIDLKAGLMLSSEFDPYLGTRVTFMGQFYYLLALIYYITISGHHYFIRAMADSFYFIPLGSGIMGPHGLTELFRLFADLFIVAFTISSPVIMILLLVDISLGFLGKTVPQVHVFILGLPIKTVLSMFVLALLLPVLGGVLEAVLDRFLNVFYSLMMGWR